MLWSGLSVLITAGIIGGCADPGACVSPMATTRGAVSATSTDCTLTTGGADVLRLTAPAGTTCKAADGSLHVDAPKYDVELWLVPGARTVDEGVARVGPQIADEFKDFKADTTTDLTVAGSAAKRLVGSGHEADDGDPGTADVIVFALGDRASVRVFVACNHGETINAAGRDGMLALVQTARMP